MSTELPLDDPIPIEYFKIARKIKCLPLLEPKLLDDNLKRLKHKRRDVKRAVRRIVKSVPFSYQLECYVCQNQPDNKNKCAETVKICDLQQDQCLTEVRWGSIPYWSLTDQKQHFISKRCATKRECQEATSDRLHKCDRIGYNDWNCTNCCSGDKCNYYVTLAASSLKPTNILVAVLALATSFIAMHRSVYSV